MRQKMKRIYKIMRDKKGEGYIDAVVVVFCVMFVIALGVRIFPVFITKIQLDNFADELVREAEISGRAGCETTARAIYGIRGPWGYLWQDVFSAWTGRGWEQLCPL